MLGQLALVRLPAALHLSGCVRPKVQMSGPLVFQLADAEDLGFESGATALRRCSSGV